MINEANMGDMFSSFCVRVCVCVLKVHSLFGQVSTNLISWQEIYGDENFPSFVKTWLRPNVKLKKRHFL